MTDTQQQTPLSLGFGLIELLISLACVGIVLSWGWPHYQTFLQRQHRAQARSMLLQAALWMERSASANGQYPLPQNVPDNLLVSDDLRYQLQVNSTADSYTLTATPKEAQLNDPCGTLMLSHTGARSVKNNRLVYDANTCWQR